MLFGSLVLAARVAAVNHPPVLTVRADEEPVIHDFGRRIELPFNVYDADGDALTLRYRFDNSGDWLETPASDTPNIVPGSIFANLDPKVPHTMEVMAFDGQDSSQPVTYGFLSFFRKLGSRIKRFARKALPVLMKVVQGVAKAGLLPGGSLINKAVGAGIGMLQGRMSHVSYSIDGGSWSEPVAYPEGDQEVFVFGDESEPYLRPGEHSIVFRFEDEAGWVNEEELQYTVNSPPTLRVTKDEPIALGGAPVALPIAVSDADGHPVTVFYRFEGDDVWSRVPAENGAYVLPASAFAGRADGAGALELFAWDGVEKSGKPLAIPFTAAA
jgi:hypothetical protein